MLFVGKLVKTVAEVAPIYRLVSIRKVGMRGHAGVSCSAQAGDCKVGPHEDNGTEYCISFRWMRLVYVLLPPGAVANEKQPSKAHH